MVTSKTLLTIVVSAALGALVAVLLFCDVDLVATKVQKPVVLSEDLRLTSPYGIDVVLPKGTALNFESEYEDEKYLTLTIITTTGEFENLTGTNSVAYVAE